MQRVPPRRQWSQILRRPPWVAAASASAPACSTATAAWSGPLARCQGWRRLRLKSARPPRSQRVCAGGTIVCDCVMRDTSGGSSQPDQAPSPHHVCILPQITHLLFATPSPARPWSSSVLVGSHFLSPRDSRRCLWVFRDELEVLLVSKESRAATHRRAEGGEKRLRLWDWPGQVHVAPG